MQIKTIDKIAETGRYKNANHVIVAAIQHGIFCQLYLAENNNLLLLYGAAHLEEVGEDEQLVFLTADRQKFLLEDAEGQSNAALIFLAWEEDTYSPRVEVTATRVDPQ